MKILIYVITALLVSLSAKAQFGGDHAGNGGNDVGIEFESSFHRAIDNIHKYKIKGLEKVAQIDFEYRLPELKVVVVNEPLLVTVGENTQECVAINYPIKQTVHINGANWRAISDPNVREGLALHEILSLIGLETSGKYPYSGRYLSTFSLDPVSTYDKYPVHTGDLEISEIKDARVSVQNMFGVIDKGENGYDVSVRLINEYRGGAAGMERLILVFFDTSAEKSGYGGDGSHAVVYEVDYVNNRPKNIKLVKISEFLYRLTFKVDAIIPPKDDDEDQEYKYKIKTVTADIHLDSAYSITDVTFKE